MTIETIKCEIERAYKLRVDELNFIRESGSVAYELKSGGRRYFLRVLKPAFPHASRVALDVQLYLEAEGFPVTHIVRTVDGSPLAKTAAGALVLYDFVDGTDTDPERDAEEVGELVGRMHSLMRGFSGELPTCEREYTSTAISQYCARKTTRKRTDLPKSAAMHGRKLKICRADSATATSIRATRCALPAASCCSTSTPPAAVFRFMTRWSTAIARIISSLSWTVVKSRMRRLKSF